ncbi:MAG: 2-oxoacid:ferredoxin oxidoreductase subunit beta [Dehalococcoidia bacterium]|nr:2-oxoacid:ferredoxin oxidoreductase subunit beta [Dehalococcoidia bacterium]
MLPDLGIPNHKTLIVSGIGCSSRIPAYVATYGFNSIHGRAVAIAQGAKLANPELTVMAIGGDGDFFSIGAGHLPHAVRRNIDITCIMVNNFVYALTKGQTSPTTPYLERGEGLFLSGEFYPPVDPILDMISYSVSTQSSFVAQGIAIDVPHLAWLIEEGIKHRGFSFISVLTPCVVFNPPELFNTIREKASYLREGELVELPDTSTEKPWLHDPGDISLALRLAQVSVLEKPHLGIFFRGKVKGDGAEHVHLPES